MRVPHIAGRPAGDYGRDDHGRGHVHGRLHRRRDRKSGLQRQGLDPRERRPRFLGVRERRPERAVDPVRDERPPPRVADQGPREGAEGTEEDLRPRVGVEDGQSPARRLERAEPDGRLFPRADSPQRRHQDDWRFGQVDGEGVWR